MNRTFRRLAKLKSETEKPKFRERPYTCLITKIGEIVEFHDGIIPQKKAFERDDILYINYIYKNGKTKVIKRPQ